jgi:hypothetical protein
MVALRIKDTRSFSGRNWAVFRNVGDLTAMEVPRLVKGLLGSGQRHADAL